MKTTLGKIVLLSVMPLFMAACATVPYTGRTQVMFTSESEETQMGMQAWDEVLSKYKICKNKKTNALVNRVGRAIAAVADKPEYQWEFKVFETNQANAFCLPGGKVAVFTGILKYMDCEAELAAVVGHEVGHAIARHGGERVSQGMLQQAGAAIVAASVDSPTEQQLALLIYGGATNLGAILPYSRTHEYEADHIGMILMAKAGYDPRYAIKFWEKFSKVSSESELGEWFSTHPIGKHRVEELKKLLPEAMKYYNKAKVKRGGGAKL